MGWGGGWGLRLPPDRGSEGSSRGRTLRRGDPDAPLWPPEQSRLLRGKEKKKRKKKKKRKDQSRDPRRTGPPVCPQTLDPSPVRAPTRAQCVPNQEKHKQYFY